VREIGRRWAAASPGRWRVAVATQRAPVVDDQTVVIKQQCRRRRRSHHVLQGTKVCRYNWHSAGSLG